MQITDTELLGLINAWLWPLCRIGALVMAAPIIGTRTVPARIRLVLALGITLAVAPAIPPPPPVNPLSGAGLLITLEQIAVGAALGLAVRVVFVALEVAGQIIGQQMGLGFAAMVDPQSGAQVPVVSQFYIVLGTLAFLAVNGHLILIEVLVDSFRSLPVGSGGISREGLWQVVEFGGWLLAHAVLIALPAMTALLVINLAFGVMTRSAPQLNIFAVGFPIMILLGTGVMLLTLSAFQPQLVALFERGLNLSRGLAGA